MLRPTLLKTFCVLIAFSSCLIAEESAVQKFAADLIAAKTDEDRAQLLNQHPDLITVELRKALMVQADSLRVKSDFKRAMTAFRVAKQVAEKINDTAGLTEVLIEIGLMYRIEGNIPLALENIQKSLTLAEELGDKLLIARGLLYMGVAYRFMADIDKALIYTNKAMELLEYLPEKEKALGWNNIGGIYHIQGNFAKAILYFEKGLQIRERLGNKDAIAGSLNNIAVAYDSQGSFAEALEYYKRSLKIREELGDKANIANVLNNMGDVRLLGSYDLALEYNKRSLALAQEIGDKPLIALAVGNIANAYNGKGDYEKGLEYSLKALNLAEELQNKEQMAIEQKHVAEAYFMKGDYEKALQYAQLTENLARETGDRQQLWTGLEAQARCFRKLNQPERAKKAYEESIATIEDWRSLVAGGELEQQALFSEKLSAYHGMIELMVEQNQIAEALRFSERAKARALLDVLHSGRLDISKSMTAAEHDEEARWNKQIVDLNNAIQEQKTSSNPDSTKIKELESSLEKVRLDYEGFRTKLYAVHPELKLQRGEPDVIKLDDSENLFPDSTTAVLEFAVIETGIFLFTLRANQIAPEVHKIDIEQEALAEKIRKYRGQISNRDADFRTSAKELYGILITPALKELAGKSKLIIVPDDTLWELPFQTLLSKENRYLLQDYSISYIPSLTVLHEMRKLRKVEPSAAPTILAFGNPALGKETVRDIKLSFRSANLTPLPEAEAEVKTLGKIYGATKSKIFVGADASEDRFKNEAASFEILHLATHGILDDASPMYSYLALTKGDSKSEDGFLEARELMNMDLKADLVTLSACETGLGKVGKGEGIIGLSWALFVAGVPATVVSQWKVDSAGTTDLMLNFHRNLKAGVSKAEALRNASLKLLKSTQYSHPFFWAPFVLVGDGY